MQFFDLMITQERLSVKILIGEEIFLVFIYFTGALYPTVQGPDQSTIL